MNLPAGVLIKNCALLVLIREITRAFMQKAINTVVRSGRLVSSSVSSL